MFSLGVKAFVRKLWQNIFIALQLAVTLFLTIQIVSSIENRVGLYYPIKDIISGKGVLLGSDWVLGSEEDIISEYNGVTEIYGTYKSGLSFPTGLTDPLEADSMDGSVTAIDSKCADIYTPKMKSGVWLDKANTTGDTLKAVVSESTYGLQVGDTFEAAYLKDEDSGTWDKATIEVVGVIADDNPVLWTAQSNYSQDADFRSLYKTYNKKTNALPLVLVSAEQLENIGITPVYVNNNIIVKMSDNTTETQERTLAQTLSGDAMGTAVTLTDLQSNSVKYITAEITKIFPLMLCILILMLVSTISLNGLSVKSQLKTYATYYILGARWNECIKINLISSVITSLVAVIMTTAAISTANAFGLLEDTVMTFGTPQLLCCLVVIAVNLLASLVLPIMIMRANTPKEILTN